MSAPTVITILQLGAPLWAAALVGAALLLTRTVENGRELRASREARRAASGQPGPEEPSKPAGPL